MKIVKSITQHTLSEIVYLLINKLHSYDATLVMLYSPTHQCIPVYCFVRMSQIHAFPLTCFASKFSGNNAVNGRKP